MHAWRIHVPTYAYADTIHCKHNVEVFEPLDKKIHEHIDITMNEDTPVVK